MDDPETKRATAPDAAQVMDLRGVRCPQNTFLILRRLEQLAPGQVLVALVDPGEPARRVPWTLINEGHRVLDQAPEGGAVRIVVERS